MLITGAAVVVDLRNAGRSHASAQAADAAGDAVRLLRSHLLDAETAARGFLLTGDRGYLEPYRQSSLQAAASLRVLGKSLGVHARSSPIQELGVLIPLKFDQWDTVVGAFERGGLSRALAVVQNGEGLDTTLRIRAILARFESGQESLNRRATAESLRYRQRTLVAGLSGAVVVLALLAVASVGLYVNSHHNQRLLSRLVASQQGFRRLSARLRDLREADRASLARRVHDDLGQALTAIKLDASRASRHVWTDPQQVKSMLEVVQQLADGAVHVARDLSMELRPAILDQLGIVAALEWKIAELRQRSSLGIRFRAELAEPPPLQPAAQVAMFRIAQEALTNVLRHARAHNLDVTLIQSDGHVVLTVADDGVGVPDERIHSPYSLGLIGMREQAAAVGAAFAVERRASGGLQIVLSVPTRACIPAEVP
jgi:signal transduction histidine kinase